MQRERRLHVQPSYRSAFWNAARADARWFVRELRLRQREQHDLQPFCSELLGADSEPAQGTNPTNLWQTGETIADEHLVDLPADLPPGQYAVEVGLYHLGTGERIRIVGGGDSLVVGRASVPE